MFTFIKGILILGCVCLPTLGYGLVYAEEEKEPISEVSSVSTDIESKPEDKSTQHFVPIKVTDEDRPVTFTDWVNARPYTVYVSKSDERQRLREYWKDRLGADIFLPYFKAREIADKVEQKSNAKVLRLHGKAHITEQEAKYIFKLKF